MPAATVIKCSKNPFVICAVLKLKIETITFEVKHSSPVLKNCIMSTQESHNSVLVQEVQPGLFRLRYDIRKLTENYFETVFALYGSQSGKSYLLSFYPKECKSNTFTLHDREMVLKSWDLHLTLRNAPIQPVGQQPPKISEDEQQLLQFWRNEALGSDVILGVLDNNEWTLSTFPVFLPTVVTLWMEFGSSQSLGAAVPSRRLYRILRNQICCDVYFQFPGNEERIGAHVYFLATRSPVFSALFQYPGQQQSSKRIITIENMEISVFKALLKYLYSGITPISIKEEYCRSLYDAAERFEIEALKTLSIDSLTEVMNVENVVDILIWSHVRSVPSLFQAANKMIIDNALELGKRSKWLNLMKNYPELFILVAA